MFKETYAAVFGTGYDSEYFDEEIMFVCSDKSKVEEFVKHTNEQLESKNLANSNYKPRFTSDAPRYLILIDVTISRPFRAAIFSSREDVDRHYFQILNRGAHIRMQTLFEVPSK